MNPPLQTRADWSELIVGALAAAVLAGFWFFDYIRPGSLSRTARRKVDSHPAIVWLFAGVVVMLCAQSGVLFASTRLPWPRTAAAETLAGQGVLALGHFGAGSLGALFMLHLLFARAGGESTLISGSSLLRGLRAAAPLVIRGLFLTILITPILITVANVSSHVATLITHVPPDRIAHGTLSAIIDNRADPWAWVLIACAVIGAPIMEEVMYRVSLQSAALRLTGSPLAAICISTTLFALMHRLSASPVPWHAIPTIAVLGLVLAISYERSKSVWIPITVHAAFNASNVVLALLTT